MLSTLLIGLFLAVCAFADKLIFAVMILLMARTVTRLWRRLRVKLLAIAAPLALRATIWWQTMKRRMRFAFGPTVRVSA